jgi:O-antigen/teichoic acid export membrane protein
MTDGLAENKVPSRKNTPMAMTEMVGSTEPADGMPHPTRSNSLPLEPITSKFAHAVSYAVIAMVIGRLSGVLVSILLARFLGDSLLGMYAIVQSTVGLYATLLGFGLGLAGTKMMAQHYMNEPEKAGRILGLLLLTLGISVSFGVGIYWWSLPLLADRIYAISGLLPLLRLALLWLIVTSIIQLLESILAGLQGFKSLMVTSSAFSILSLPLNLAALFLGGSNALPNLVVAGTVAAVIQLILLTWAIRSEARKHGVILSFRQLRPLVRPVFLDFCAPAFIGKVLEQPLSWVSILLLVKLGGSLSSVGGLSVINNIRTWALYFPMILGSVLVPLLTDIYYTRNRDTFRRTLVFNQRLLWLTTFPILVLLVAIVHPTVGWLFGASFEIFWQAGAVFLTWAILVPINEVNDRAMVAMGKMWLSLTFRMIYLVLFITGLWLLIPGYHLLGYVIAGGISYLIYVTAQTWWLQRVTQERPSSILVLTLFSVVCLAIAYSIAQFDSAGEAMFYGLLLFGGTLWVEWKWLVRPEEKSMLSAQMEKTLQYLRNFVSRP